jgi:hypothetical protein
MTAEEGEPVAIDKPSSMAKERVMEMCCCRRRCKSRWGCGSACWLCFPNPNVRAAQINAIASIGIEFSDRMDDDVDNARPSVQCGPPALDFL